MKINKLREGEPEARATERAAREQLTRSEKDLRRKKDIVQDLEMDMQNIQRFMNAAKATQKNAINRFGSSTGQILEAISTEKRFRVQPKGPVGAFVSVIGKKLTF